MPTGAAVDSPKSLTRKKLWRGGKWGGQGTTRVGAGGTALAPGNGLPAPPGGSCHNRHAAPSTPRDGEKRQGEGWAVLHSAPVPSPRVSWDVGRSPVLDKETQLTPCPLPPSLHPAPSTLHPVPSTAASIRCQISRQANAGCKGHSLTSSPHTCTTPGRDVFPPLPQASSDVAMPRLVPRPTTLLDIS